MYKLVSGAIVILTNRTTENFTKEHYVIKDGKHAYIMKFDGAGKKTGHVAFLKNTPVLGLDDFRFWKESVQFRWIGNCFILFTQNVSYAVKYRCFFKGMDREYWNNTETAFDIMKHPLLLKHHLKPEDMIDYALKKLQKNTIIEAKVDDFGLSVIDKQENTFTKWKFYPNGLITFGMMKDTYYVIKFLTFFIEYFYHLNQNEKVKE